jgi:hypothetical protein
MADKKKKADATPARGAVFANGTFYPDADSAKAGDAGLTGERTGPAAEPPGAVSEDAPKPKAKSTRKRSK